eukprot:1056567-Rhodomonas_salina.1
MICVDTDANAAAIDEVDLKGRTELPVYRVAESRDNWNEAVQKAKQLIEGGANVNQATHNGSTPLIAAAHQGHMDMVKCLLNAGADVNSTSQGSHSALHHASWKGHREIFLLLYHHEETTLETKQPLAAKPAVDICKKNCSTDKHIGPKCCWNFLLWEYTKTHDLAVDLVQAVRRHNLEEITHLCSLRPKDMDLPVDCSGSTLLHIAAEEGRYEVVRRHGKCEVVRLLLESGAVVNVKNRAGEYPVHCGAFSFDRETFTVLYLKTDAINCQVFKSKHTECVEKKTGLTCSCSHCREWTKLTWSPHFDGQVCQPAVGFH